MTKIPAPEFGIVMEPSPGYTAPLAAEIEALGFDALLCPDTRCLIQLGLDHVYLLGGSPVPTPHGTRQEAMVRQTRLFAEQVLPKLR